MTVVFTDTNFFSDLCEEIRLFLDIRRIEKLKTATPLPEGFSVIHHMLETDGAVISTAVVYMDGKPEAEYEYSAPAGSGALEKKRNAKRACKISVYRALSKHFVAGMPWGSLTGIRPTKLLRDSEASLGEKGAKALFLDEFDVSHEKYALAKAITRTQESLLPDDNNIDVYIGIPFCTTRCAYCSFASNTPGVFADAEKLYVNALLGELSAAEDILAGYCMRSVYIGGGTPTALGPEELRKVLSRAAKLAAGAKEFTVEAGRPDTITGEKLDIIKSAGAGRISVNAQTLNESTLSRIGRKHTSQEFFEAFGRARKAGFDINVDIIAGLPGETEKDTAATLKGIIALGPENITVHTLAIKRASRFAMENMDAFPGDAETARMTAAAKSFLEDAGYRPYYMYRQKYMKGSLENAGYSLPGKECLYNIDVMEELCSVAAFGAGAISKRVFCGGERIERAANIKDLRLYIEKAGEMIERKLKLFG